MSDIHITVAIATLGRPVEVRETVGQLERQTRRANRVIVSATALSDYPYDDQQVLKLFGPKGLCAQRNRALDALGRREGLIVFIDDDYVLSIHALERLARFFASHPNVVGANGHMIADGIGGSGIASDAAFAAIAAYDAHPQPEPRILGDIEGLYGCNMAFRTEAIGGTRFDECLPLYGWQEDIDFSAQVGRKGRLVKSNAWAGVHRGVKSGRISGVRFGYSQIANPLYLKRKGTMSAGFAYTLLVRNVVANHLRAVRPEPWIDRVGRVRGNWRAMRDLMRGALRPEAILEFP